MACGHRKVRGRTDHIYRQKYRGDRETSPANLTLTACILSYMGAVPGKRGNRPFKVLEVDFSGLPINQDSACLIATRASGFPENIGGETVCLVVLTVGRDGFQL